MTSAVPVSRDLGPDDHRSEIATIREAQRSAAPWPYATLDLLALHDSGWRPTPIYDFVIKVHQRCNLACDYCYVYASEDQSWLDKPAAMPQDVWQATADAIGQHVLDRGLRHIRVVLHGGEPLLFGNERIGALVSRLRAVVPRECALEIGMQSNGLLLTTRRLDALREFHIMFGISIDGTAKVHDRHRFTRKGEGSFAGAARALDLLRQPANRKHYAGILCTVAPDTDPIACYEQLLAFEPPMVDLLLPHANWQHPPQANHAEWLIAVFDRWYADGAPTRIRLFEDVISLHLGGGSRSEQIGLSPNAVVVIESDGTIEQVDALKSAYPGACATGLDIRRDPIDAVLEDPGVVARQLGIAALSDICLSCQVHPVCGARHYAHRFRSGHGFRNPSAYCNDLYTLINHVRHRLAVDVNRLVAGAEA